MNRKVKNVFEIKNDVNLVETKKDIFEDVLKNIIENSFLNTILNFGRNTIIDDAFDTVNHIKYYAIDITDTNGNIFTW